MKENCQQIATPDVFRGKAAQNTGEHGVRLFTTFALSKNLAKKTWGKKMNEISFDKIYQIWQKISEEAGYKQHSDALDFIARDENRDTFKVLYEFSLTFLSVVNGEFSGNVPPSPAALEHCFLPKLIGISSLDTLNEQIKNEIKLINVETFCLGIISHLACFNIPTRKNVKSLFDDSDYSAQLNYTTCAQIN